MKAFSDLIQEVLIHLSRTSPKAAYSTGFQRTAINVQLVTDRINGRTKENLQLIRKGFNSGGSIGKKDIEENIGSELKYFILKYRGDKIRVGPQKTISDQDIEEYLITDSRTTAKIFRPFAEFEENTFQNVEDYKRSPHLIIKDTLAIFLGYLGWEGYTKGIRIQAIDEPFSVSTQQNHGYGPLSRYISDFGQHIENKTKGFVGREHLFDAVSEFTQNNRSGYFRITGKPGVGKSAFMARFVERFHVPHLFVNGYGIGNVGSRNCLSEIWARLAVEFQLPVEEILSGIESEPPSPNFMMSLLQLVSQKLQHDRKLVFVIDGLDELSDLTIGERKNILHFPNVLPYGIFFLLSMRDPDDYPHLSSFHPRTFDLDQEQNEGDIVAFIQQKMETEGIQEYLLHNRVEAQEFERVLKEKSENNFMYLSVVLEEIASGHYKDTTLTELPQGLIGYYEDHWQRMKGVDENAWFKYKLPVIASVTMAVKPVTVSFIARATNIKDYQLILSTLSEWKHFFSKIEGQTPKDPFEGIEYELYHKSFRDFLEAKDEIGIENVKLKEALSGFGQRIADELLGKGWDDVDW